MGWTSLFGRLTRRPETRKDGLPQRTLDLLAQPLSQDFIGERDMRDGRSVQFLEGWAAIDQANRLFGFDAWGAELVDSVSYHPLRLIDDLNQERLATGVYTATVRVTVRGCVPKSDIGCAFVKADTPEEHETACKGAVTDAMKRALRQYGDQFGNRLYDKRRSAMSDDSVGGSRSRPNAEELRRRVVSLSKRLGRSEEHTLVWVRDQYETPLDEMSEDQLAEAVRSIAGQLNQRNSNVNGRRNGHTPVAS